MSRFSIAFAYAVPAALMLLVFAASQLMGDPGMMTFHKVLYVPVFLLASRGLRQSFPEHLDRTRDMMTAIEFQVLNSALLSAFILAVSPLGQSGLQTLVALFPGMTILMAALNIGLLAFDRYGRAKKR